MSCQGHTTNQSHWSTACRFVHSSYTEDMKTSFGGVFASINDLPQLLKTTAIASQKTHKQTKKQQQTKTQNTNKQTKPPQGSQSAQDCHPGQLHRNPILKHSTWKRQKQKNDHPLYFADKTYTPCTQKFQLFIWLPLVWQTTELPHHKLETILFLSVLPHYMTQVHFPPSSNMCKEFGAPSSTVYNNPVAVITPFKRIFSCQGKRREGKRK